MWPVHSRGPSEQKPIKILEKKERIQGLSNFFISRTGKATKFTFCTHIHMIDHNKSPLKLLENVAVGILRDSQKFSGHPFTERWAHHAVSSHLCGSLAFLLPAFTL